MGEPGMTVPLSLPRVACSTSVVALRPSEYQEDRRGCRASGKSTTVRAIATPAPSDLGCDERQRRGGRDAGEGVGEDAADGDGGVGECG